VNRQKEYRKFLLMALGGKCKKCGSSEKLVIHHKRYGEDLTLEDLDVLCKHCHPTNKKPGKKIRRDHIAIKESTKKEFEKQRLYPRETHDEVMRRILEDRKKNQGVVSPD